MPMGLLGMSVSFGVSTLDGMVAFIGTIIHAHPTLSSWLSSFVLRRQGDFGLGRRYDSLFAARPGIVHRDEDLNLISHGCSLASSCCRGCHLNAVIFKTSHSCRHSWRTEVGPQNFNLKC